MVEVQNLCVFLPRDWEAVNDTICQRPILTYQRYVSMLLAILVLAGATLERAEACTELWMQDLEIMLVAWMLHPPVFPRQIPILSDAKLPFLPTRLWLACIVSHSCDTACAQRRHAELRALTFPLHSRRLAASGQAKDVYLSSYATRFETYIQHVHIVL